MSLAQPPGDWVTDAVCRQVDPDLWYPDQHDSSGVRWAKALCVGACPVRAECLDYALANNEQHGVFGGLSPRERMRLRSEERAS